jgi:hypothetical protein
MVNIPYRGNVLKSKLEMNEDTQLKHVNLLLQAVKIRDFNFLKELDIDLYM